MRLNQQAHGYLNLT